VSCGPARAGKEENGHAKPLIQRDLRCQRTIGIGERQPLAPINGSSLPQIKQNESHLSTKGKLTNRDLSRTRGAPHFMSSIPPQNHPGRSR